MRGIVENISALKVTKSSVSIDNDTSLCVAVSSNIDVKLLASQLSYLL